LVQHVAAKCFPALVRLPKLMVGSQRYDPSLLLGAGVATHRPLSYSHCPQNVSTLVNQKPVGARACVILDFSPYRQKAANESNEAGNDSNSRR
jgi:hypothetical protein